MLTNQHVLPALPEKALEFILLFIYLSAHQVTSTKALLERKGNLDSNQSSWLIYLSAWINEIKYAEILYDMLSMVLYQNSVQI